MSIPRRIIAVLLVATFAAALVAGCGLLPTAPTVNKQTAATQTAATQTASPHSGQVAQSNSLLGSVGSIVGSLVNLIVKVLTIVGSVGGSLTNGRWQVVVPAGAIDGTATIS